MSMLDQFQELDRLILDNTHPPVVSILRNQLSLLREQTEAYQAASDKQDETLATQANTIAALQMEFAKGRVANAECEKQLSDMKARDKSEFYDWVRQRSNNQAELRKRDNLPEDDLIRRRS
jgi:hypothetical protein